MDKRLFLMAAILLFAPAQAFAGMQASFVITDFSNTSAEGTLSTAELGYDSVLASYSLANGSGYVLADGYATAAPHAALPLRLEFPTALLPGVYAFRVMLVRGNDSLLLSDDLTISGALPEAAASHAASYLLLMDMDVRAAVARSLNITGLSPDDVEAMIAVSMGSGRYFSAETSIFHEGNRSSMVTTVAYSGNQPMKNVLVAVWVPKGFAPNASMVAVSAGGMVTTAKEDPAWVIHFSEVSPGETKRISFDADGMADGSLADETMTEIYLEPETESYCAPMDQRCSGSTLQNCTFNGKWWVWMNADTCQMGCNSTSFTCVASPAPVMDEKEDPLRRDILIGLVILLIFIGAVISSVLVKKYQSGS